MKKRNLVLQTAIATAIIAMAAGAQAGSLTGAATYATENFGSTATSALAIGAPATVYTFNTPGGIVVNPTGAVYMYFRVAGAKFAAAPAAPTLSASISGLTATVSALSTDGTTFRVALTNGGATNVVIGIGGTVTFAQGALSLNAVNTTLATAGGAVTMTASVGSTSNLPDSTTALTADLDNGISTVTTATAAAAITGVVASSATFTVSETQKVDLTATSPGSRFTAPGPTASNANSATVVNLGSVAFSNVTGSQFSVAGTADYAIATEATATALAGTVTGTFKTGSTMTLTTDLACTTAIAAGSAGTLNAGLTTFTFAGGTTAATAIPYYVCLTTPATAGAIPLGAPVAAFTLAKTIATNAANAANGTLYALANNGATVDVRSYIPAAATGYTTFIRAINTGAVSAAVTGQILNADGTQSATFALGTLAAGGSITWTSTQIEAAAAFATPLAGTVRPRLRLTAPTNGLQAQSFILTNANGNFSDATGAQ